MPADPNESDESNATLPPARHSITRRALLGLALMGTMTGGAASLLYGSLEPDAEFAADPDASQRRAALASVFSWQRWSDLTDGEASSANPVSVLVFEGPTVADLRRSVAQKRVEALQEGQDGKRRPVLGTVRIGPKNEHSTLADESRLVDALIERGLDGIFLDGAAALADANARGRAAADQLAVAVVELVGRARQLNPNFLVILENAAEMAADPRVNRVIDGAAKENVLFGLDGAGIANSRTDVISMLHDLNRVKRSGRPVFVTEHLPVEAIGVRTGAGQTLSALGFVGRFAPPKGAS